MIVYVFSQTVQCKANINTKQKISASFSLSQFSPVQSRLLKGNMVGHCRRRRRCTSLPPYNESSYTLKLTQQQVSDQVNDRLYNMHYHPLTPLCGDLGLSDAYSLVKL